MKKLLLFFLLFLSISVVFASECYHYHTSKNFNIIQKSGKYYVEFKEFDPNGISISHYGITPLHQNFKGLIKVLPITSNTLYFYDDEFYYGISINYALEDSYKVFKLGRRSEIRKINEDGYTEFSDGNYKQIIIDQHSDEPTYIPLKNFPKSSQIISSMSNYGVLVKNSEGVYIYVAEDDRVEKILGLDPKTTVFKPSPEMLESHFLYDSDTFYLVDDSFTGFDDITAQFKNYKVNFLDLKFIVTANINSVFFKDDKNGILWAYSPAGVGMDNGDSHNIVPLKGALFLNSENSLFKYNNQYYLDPYDAVFGFAGINVSSVKNIYKLTPSKFPDLYEDGDEYYEYDYDRRIFKKLSLPISGSAIYYEGVYSYRHGYSGFFDDGRDLFFLNGDYKIYRKIPHKKAIKNLQLAFALDDKLFIEDNIIPNLADYETMQFLKSTVDPEQPCDGGNGQIPIIVNYTYYFKDKNGYYKYVTDAKSLSKVDATEIKKEGLDKISVNKKENQKKSWLNIKNLGIAVASIAVAGSAVWFFTKNRKA